jgi:hypothetical protein
VIFLCLYRYSLFRINLDGYFVFKSTNEIKVIVTYLSLVIFFIQLHFSDDNYFQLHESSIYY